MGRATLINLGRIIKGGPAVASDMSANLISLRDAVNNVASEQILSNAVTAAKINASAVTTPKIANGALTADTAGRAKMAAKFTTQALIDNLAVGTAQLIAAAVTRAKQEAGSAIWLATGSYVGNGNATGPLIVGVGFQAKLLLVSLASSNKMWIGFDGDGATAGSMNARPVWDNGGISGADAFLLNADGFDIKHNSNPNANTLTYTFIAIGTN